MKIVPMSLELLDFMGSDLSVVNAARVSFNKESTWTMKPAYAGSGGIYGLKSEDERLIRYLAKHNHWSPFSHVFLSFRIKVPMFIAMQLDKHTVGLTTNSVSRRYVSSDPEFYFPETWRKAAENVKQGSSDEVFAEWSGNAHQTLLWECGTAQRNFNAYEVALAQYVHYLQMGMCPEQARMVLPMNTMRESIWSGSLAAFARVYKLRSDPHAQKEIREVANKLSILVPQQMKHSWEALTE